MSNLQILQNGTKNEQLFANTITSFAKSQGFCYRLCNNVNDLDCWGLDDLKEELEKQNFESTLDVVLWLEC